MPAGYLKVPTAIASYLLPSILATHAQLRRATAGRQTDRQTHRLTHSLTDAAAAIPRIHGGFLGVI